MNDSIRIGSVFGITIRVHVLFLFMMGALVILSSQPAAMAGLMALLFGLVFLHELGHSLVAQSFGIRVVDITFWPLGGMARMNDIPESSRIEGLVALAGPAVNFALALGGLALMVIAGGLSQLTETDLLAGIGSPLALFVWLNLMLGGFNLIPAFPMDGGRVLRAWLARSRDWVLATEQAVRVGRFVALLMAVAGLFLGNCMMVLIAGFVWWIGARELWSVRLRHGLSPFAGRFSSSGPGGMGGDATWYDREGGLFDGPPDSLGHLFRAMRQRGGQSLEDELERDYEAFERDERTRGEAPPRPDDDGGPRRPGVESKPEPGGFSDEDIERLERFKGRLRRDDS